MRCGWKALGTIIVLAAITMVPFAKADDWDKETKVTLSAPVAVPGQVLPSGRYVFRLADNDSDRNVVQIFDAEKSHIITTVLAIPAYRLEPTGDTVITFEERPSGNVEAIGTWFFAGENQGVAFAYPWNER
jgi:hypothetical protein